MVGREQQARALDRLRARELVRQRLDAPGAAIGGRDRGRALAHGHHPPGGAHRQVVAHARQQRAASEQRHAVSQQPQALVAAHQRRAHRLRSELEHLGGAAMDGHAPRTRPAGEPRRAAADREQPRACRRRGEHRHRAIFGDEARASMVTHQRSTRTGHHLRIEVDAVLPGHPVRAERQDPARLHRPAHGQALRRCGAWSGDHQGLRHRFPRRDELERGIDGLVEAAEQLRRRQARRRRRSERAGTDQRAELQRMGEVPMVERARRFLPQRRDRGWGGQVVARAPGLAWMRGQIGLRRALDRRQHSRAAIGGAAAQGIADAAGPAHREIDVVVVGYGRAAMPQLRIQGRDRVGVPSRDGHQRVHRVAGGEAMDGQGLRRLLGQERGRRCQRCEPGTEPQAHAARDQARPAARAWRQQCGAGAHTAMLPWAPERQSAQGAVGARSAGHGCRSRTQQRGERVVPATAYVADWACEGPTRSKVRA